MGQTLRYGEKVPLDCLARGGKNRHGPVKGSNDQKQMPGVRLAHEHSPLKRRHPSRGSEPARECASIGSAAPDGSAPVVGVQKRQKTA